MSRKTKKQKAAAESSHARSQRRRAERIITASDCYSLAFRNEVQAALDSAPFKLRPLFREADQMDKLLAASGQRTRSSARGPGSLIGGPRTRSPKNGTARMAEEIEALFNESEADNLDENWSSRAQLISNILFEMGNESGVNATHPALVKGYFIALSDAVSKLEGHDYDTVQKALAHVRELMDGRDPARHEQIDNFYSLDYKVADKARREEAGEVYVPPASRRASSASPDAPADPVESEELACLREKLERLERLPENEAIAFQLESEIFKLEHETKASTEEWPDIIGHDRMH